MSDRIYNFGAGPGVLPEPVLRSAQRDIWNVANSGMGVMEHSHRGKVFDAIIQDAERQCRDLAGIGDDYEVLFVQGGASLQCAMVPMNFLPPGGTADYLVTGVWAEKAVKEAKIFGTVHEAVSCLDEFLQDGLRRIHHGLGQCFQCTIFSFIVRKSRGAVKQLRVQNHVFEIKWRLACYHTVLPCCDGRAFVRSRETIPYIGHRALFNIRHLLKII